MISTYWKRMVKRHFHEIWSMYHCIGFHSGCSVGPWPHLPCAAELPSLSVAQFSTFSHGSLTLQRVVCSIWDQCWKHAYPAAAVSIFHCKDPWRAWNRRVAWCCMCGMLGDAGGYTWITVDIYIYTYIYTYIYIHIYTYIFIYPYMWYVYIYMCVCYVHIVQYSIYSHIYLVMSVLL